MTEAQEVRTLTQHLDETKKKNPAYSLRAMARDFGVSHTYLSLVLSGRRRLPEKRAAQFRYLMGHRGDGLPIYPPVKRNPVTHTPFLKVQEDLFRILSDWRHLAILELVQIGITGSESIGMHLQISSRDAQRKLKRLERCGLLVKKQGQWSKSKRFFAFETDRSMRAVRGYHSKMLELAKRELRRTSPENFRRRDISGCTLSVDPEKIPEARIRIKRFRRRLSKFLAEGNAHEVYQLNIQLFPLLRPRQKK